MKKLGLILIAGMLFWPPVLLADERIKKDIPAEPNPFEEARLRAEKEGIVKHNQMELALSKLEDNIVKYSTYYIQGGIFGMPSKVTVSFICKTRGTSKIRKLILLHGKPLKTETKVILCARVGDVQAIGFAYQSREDPFSATYELLSPNQ